MMQHCLCRVLTAWECYHCRDGDVYIGSRWNTLSILYLISLAAPAAVGLFAWLSYGHLWGITPGLY